MESFILDTLDTQNRTLYFDYLRTFATFSVMAVHVSYFNWVGIDVNTTDWRILNFFFGMRWMIPVFVMISGALFLKREISISKIYSKYVVRMLTAFIFWSIIYYLFMYGNPIEQLSTLMGNGRAQAIANLLHSNYNFHLWFVPMIAGLYMCIPILRLIIQNEKITNYYLILSFIFGILIPQSVSLIDNFCNEGVQLTMHAIASNVTDMNMDLVLGYSFYFILGYKFSNMLFDSKTRYVIYTLGIIGFMTTIVISRILSIKNQVPNQNYMSNFNINVLLSAIGMFELFKNIPFKPGKLHRTMSKLSKWGLGAYLIHILVIVTLMRFGINSLAFNPVFAVPLITVLVFVISNGITALISLIPVINKYIV